jgi:uncharacterized membrane protein
MTLPSGDISRIFLFFFAVFHSVIEWSLYAYVKVFVVVEVTIGVTSPQKNWKN